MGFGKDGRGAIIRERCPSTDLGALANTNGKQVAAGLTMTEDFRCLKSEIFCDLVSLTAGQGSGLKLYRSEGDLTEAEANEVLVLDGPTTRGDRVVEETAMRYMELLGASPTQFDLASTELSFVDAYTGAPVCVSRKRWTFPNLASKPQWNYHIWNDGNILTTGCLARIWGVHYGVWLS